MTARILAVRSAICCGSIGVAVGAGPVWLRTDESAMSRLARRFIEKAIMQFIIAWKAIDKEDRRRLLY